MNSFLKIMMAVSVCSINEWQENKNNISQLEEPRIINLFTRNSTGLSRIVKDYKFKKLISAFDSDLPLSSENLGITYTLNGDTIQFYKSPIEMKLLYCNISNIKIYKKDVAFFSYTKSDIIPLKYRKTNNIKILDQAGFEELQIKFINNEIISLKYVAYPD